MTLDLSAPLLIAFLLSVLRASAWVAVAPPFGTRAVPVIVKVAVAVALALPVAPRLAATAPAPQVAPLVTAVAVQVGIGLTLGFLTSLLFAAVQAAGSILDVFAGFSIGALYDPLSGVTSSVFGRMHQLVAVTLLFATDGHLLLIRGFMGSFDAVPLHPDAGAVAQLMTRGLGTFMAAALQIAAPLVAVLVLAELALGLVGRANQSLNVLTTGFPLKILLALMFAGVTIAVLPAAVQTIVDRLANATGPLTGG